MKPILAPLLDQELVARQALGPRRETTTIILLNEHSVKTTMNNLLLSS